MDVGTVELTELEKLEVTRVDAVSRPANGFPVLLMKGVAEPVADLPAEPAVKADADDMVNCPTCKGDGKIMGGKRDCPDCDDGKVTPAKAKTLAAKAVVKAIVGRKVDETPDIAGGTAVLAQIADLIIGEAQELKSGIAGEIDDIQQLACAAEMIWCWRTGEESVASGSVMPATTLMQSAAEEWTPERVAEFKAEFEKALPGVPYRLLPPGEVIKAEDATADQIAKEGTDVDTVDQTGDLGEVVKAAVTEAQAPLLKRIADLESAKDAQAAELAKVKATPVPGGPVLSRNVQVKTPGAVSDDVAAKAALYRAKADAATSPQDRDGYLALARETEKRATTTS